ncbi:MAG: nicotinate-nucleotide diphosphorylase (carboxylating), partial [Deltaproteobacteria bacterium]|nr:nicotinate-nucleotide diphosphorylase (carboxylating) [Deltaproteobacteria bacterium]
MDFRLDSLVKLALEEDVGFGDITTRLTVSPEAVGSAVIVARKRLILSGLAAALAAFRLTDGELSVSLTAADGDELKAGAVILQVRGRAASILTAERVALNFLGHLSGIATLTEKFVRASRLADGSGPKILDTRKTTP